MKLLITGASGFIGSNFVDLLLQNNIDSFINLDKQKPLNSAHDKYWVEGNIMDKDKLSEVFSNYNPTHVVHLAARTDTASSNLDDYTENHIGTGNLIDVIEHANSVEYVIITSTQYVYKSTTKPLPAGDEDFIPHTAYGISKKISEELIRKSTMKAAWTIIRPTNVWGPWNMRYPNELLKIIDKGWYFHPGKTNPIKSFAYVKNVAHQILMMLKAPAEKVNRQVFYVGDEPMGSLNWINLFSTTLTGKKAKSFPIIILKMLSLGGDILKKFKIPFPLHSERFNNMLDSYVTPMPKTIDIFGVSHPDTKKNVEETIDWIKKEQKHRFPYWDSKY